MVKLTEYKLRETAKNKGIIGYQNRPKKELLQIIYKLKRITDKLSRNGLNKIVKIQKVSLNELKKIERMNNLSQNALEQMAITRNIKNYKDMSKEDLLIALIRSNESQTKLLNSEDNSNTKIGETKTLFNKLRSNFSPEEIKENTEKFHKKEVVCNILKEKEKVLNNIVKYFKKVKEDLSKIKAYQCNTTHDIRYSFNEITKEDYYEPLENKSTFDGNYIGYESRGDNNNNLSLEEYLNIIRPYLRDMIDNHKTHSEWKTQLIMRIIFVSSLDTNEIHIMHTKNDNIEIMSGTETSEAIKELYNSFLRRYQEGLETKMKGSGYIFERVDLLEYHFHKISPNRGG